MGKNMTGFFKHEGFIWEWSADKCTDCDDLAVFVKHPGNDRWEFADYCDAEENPETTAKDFAEKQTTP